MRLRRPLLAAIAVTATAIGTLLPATGASAASTVNGVRLSTFEARLVSDINSARAAQGLRTLTVAPGTTDVARRWSWHLADQHGLSHNPNLVAQLQAAGSADWHMISENVGFTGAEEPDTLFNAYMNSPEHRANILDPSALFLGVGVVERPLNGVLMAYNTLDFVDQYSSAYGPTREPAASMHMDTMAVRAPQSLTNFEAGRDQRLDIRATGKVVGDGLRVTGPSAGDDAATWVVHQTRSGTGLADMSLWQALDLHAAQSLKVTASVTDPARKPTTVSMWLRAPYGASVPLGRVLLPATKGTVTVPLPAAARSWFGELVFRVDESDLARFSRPVSGRWLRVTVYDVSVGS